jgi:O-antigen/teichoic acid export membrane protein
MLGPTVRSWLTAAGVVSLYKTDQFLIALYIDPAHVPAYYAIYTLLNNMAILALTLGQTSSVFVSQLWQSGRFEAIHEIVLRSLRVTLILMGCGVATLVVNGRDFISIWIGADHFVGQPVLTMLCAMFLLCAQQNALLAFSRATENEVYAPIFLIAGGLNLLFAWILVEHFGLLGIVSATLVAQLLTTNRMVVVDGLRRLRIQVGLYFWACIVPSLVASVVTLLAMILIARERWLLSSPFDRSVAAITIAGCLTLGTLWLFGLTGAERARIGARLRIALHGLPGSGP